MSAFNAIAGDIASLQPIGFSNDGSIFAFEEYGVQDGSGFPYSSIYFIDTATKEGLPGTPIRSVIKEERTSVGVARRESLEKAAPLIEKYRLRDQPGLLAAFNPVTNADGAPYDISYYTTASSPPSGQPFRLGLEEVFVGQTAAPCSHWSERNSTFRLKLLLENGRPADLVVFESGPASGNRGCITSYRLGGVVVSAPENVSVHVALVLVMQNGFEGNNGRWTAAPFKP